MHSIRMLVWVSLMVFFSTVAFAEKRMQEFIWMSLYLTDNGKIQAIDYRRDISNLDEQIKYGNQAFARAYVEQGLYRMEKWNDIDLYAEIKKWNAIYTFKQLSVGKSPGFNGFFVALTNTGLLKCLAPNERLVYREDPKDPMGWDSGLLCNGIDGIEGVEEIAFDGGYLWIFKNSGEVLRRYPAYNFGLYHDQYSNIVDPVLLDAIKNPSEHIGYFGMIKPLYPDGISDITYTYSAEYVDTGDFQDVVANVRKEHRVNGNIESLSDHLVVLFTNTSEWVYEAIDSGNLKYYTDKPLTSYKPAVYSNGDRATVTGWAIRWDVSKAKHKTWEYMREFKRNGDLEKSNAQRKVSALVFVKKPVE